MTVHITVQGIITAAAFVAALMALAGYMFRARDWVKKQDGQDKRIDDLKENHDKDISAIMDEQQLLTYGILACLKGLKEQGCNGPVTDAIIKIEKHLNEKAHHPKGEV